MSEGAQDARAKDVIRFVDLWGLILMLAVTAIWLGLMGAVVHLVRVKARH